MLHHGCTHFRYWFPIRAIAVLTACILMFNTAHPALADPRILKAKKKKSEQVLLSLKQQGSEYRWQTRKQGRSGPKLQPRQPLDVATLTPDEIVAKLIEVGLVSRTQLDSYIASIVFDDFYNFLPANALIAALRDHDLLAQNFNSVVDVRTALVAKGFDIEALQLRSDGILQVLGTPVGGSLLKYPSSDRDAVLEARNELKALFEADKKSFLRYLSSREFLALLGARLSENPAQPDPIIGFAKRGNYSGLTHTLISYRIGFFNMPQFQANRNLVMEGDILNYLASDASVNPAVAYVNAMPEGFRAIRIGGELISNLYAADGQLLLDDAGAPLTLDYLRDASGAIVRDADGKPFLGPWMDMWGATVAARFRTFFSAFAAKGGKVDYLIIDFEERDGSVPSHGYLNGQSFGVWQAIVADPRWAAPGNLRDQLGFSDADILSNIRMQQFSNNGQPSASYGDWGGASSNPTDLALRWDLIMERRRLQHLNLAIHQVAQDYFPHVLTSSFEDDFRSDVHSETVSYRFTHTWNGIGGMEGVSTGGFLPSPNVRNAAIAVNGVPPTFMQGLISMAEDSRANCAASRIKSHPVISSPDYLAEAHDENGDGIYTPGEEPPFYAESVFQIALDGARQFTIQNGAEYFSRAGAELSDRIIAELNDPHLFALSERESITFKPLSSTDQLLVGGMKAGGHLTYRVSFDHGANVSEDANGVTVSAGTESVSIPGGKIYSPPGGSVSPYGVWVIVDDISAGKPLHEELSSVVEKMKVPGSISRYVQSLNDELSAAGYAITASESSAGSPGPFTISLVRSDGKPEKGTLQSATLYLDENLNAELGQGTVSGFSSPKVLPQLMRELLKKGRERQDVLPLLTRVVVKRMVRDKKNGRHPVFQVKRKAT